MNMRSTPAGESGTSAAAKTAEESGMEGKAWHSNSTAWRTVVLFLLGVIFTTGCGIKVTSLEPEPKTSAVRVQSDEPYDIAILSTEFTPAIAEWHPGSSPTLLVAVDNQGLATVRRVTVEARLTALDGVLLAEAREVIPSLAPGEVRVVRFSAPTLVLYRPVYRLVVNVGPVEGERHVANNSRTFQIDVSSRASQEP